MEEDISSLKTKLSDHEKRLSQLEKESSQAKGYRCPTWLWALQWTCTIAMIVIISKYFVSRVVPLILLFFAILARSVQ